MITLFSQNNCAQCTASKRHLAKLGLEFIERNVSDDEEARETAASLGYRSAPVTLVQREGEPDLHWYGFDPIQLNKLAA